MNRRVAGEGWEARLLFCILSEGADKLEDEVGRYYSKDSINNHRQSFIYNLFIIIAIDRFEFSDWVY